MSDYIKNKYCGSTYSGFYEGLVSTIDLYDGSYKEIVAYCPSLFRLLCDILNDKLTDWNTKIQIDAALAYFVLPEDVIPDFADEGYVDDLFIVCHVLSQIKKQGSSKLIEKHWRGNEDILELIDHLYLESGKVVDDLRIDILRKVGLYKFEKMDLGEYSGAYPQRLAKLANEKRELLGMLAFVLSLARGGRFRKRNISTTDLLTFLKSFDEYGELERILELAKYNHAYETKKKLEKKTEISLEERLRAARLRAVFEDDKEDEE